MANDMQRAGGLRGSNEISPEEDLDQKKPMAQWKKNALWLLAGGAGGLGIGTYAGVQYAHDKDQHYMNTWLIENTKGIESTPDGDVVKITSPKEQIPVFAAGKARL